MEADNLNAMEIARVLNDNDAAREMLEAILWPNGPVCPKCGAAGGYRLTPKPGSTTRKGLVKCKACRKPFTVTVGTVFEDSHLPLGKWMHALYEMCACKNGVSALELSRKLDIGYEAAWFMCHRIRYAMGADPGAEMLKGNVEVDEAYVGGKPRPGTGPHKRGRGTDKTPVLALVERGGNVRTRVVADVTGATLKAAIRENVDRTATINTDQFVSYLGIGAEFDGGHKSVDHSAGEYVGADGGSTNTAESFFARVKRSVIGVFHRVSREHLHRYMTEAEFRWNARKITDGTRTASAIKGAVGKRLTYKPMPKKTNVWGSAEGAD
jgi:transposase-like protein